MKRPPSSCPSQPNYWPSGSAGAFIWGTVQPVCAKVNYPTPPDLVPNGAGVFTPPGTSGAAGDYYLYTKYRPTYQPFFADQVCYTPRTLDFYPGWARFTTYFGIAANTVTGCNGPQTPEQALWSRPYWGPSARRRDIISGPGWGTLRVGASNVTQLIALSRGCFWNEATVSACRTGVGSAWACERLKFESTQTHTQLESCLEPAALPIS